MEIKFNKIVIGVLAVVLAGISAYLIATGLMTGQYSENGSAEKWWRIIAGTCITGIPAVIFSLNYLWRNIYKKKEKYFRENGIPGTAMVLSCRTTGTEFNNLEQIEIELQVDDNRSKPYKIIHREFFDPVNAAKFFTGLRLNILIDPKNRKKIFMA